MINLTTGKEIIPNPDSLTISEVLEGMRKTHERFKAIVAPIPGISTLLATHQSIKAIMAPIPGVSTLLATQNSLTDIINPPGGIGGMLEIQKRLSDTFNPPGPIAMLATLNSISAIATPNPVFASLVARVGGIQSALSAIVPNGFNAHIYGIRAFYSELAEIRADPKRWKEYLKQFPPGNHSRQARTFEAVISEDGEAIKTAVIASDNVLALVCVYADLIATGAVKGLLRKVFARAGEPIPEYLPAQLPKIRNGLIKEKGLTKISKTATLKAITARIETIESALQIIRDLGIKGKAAARADLRELNRRYKTPQTPTTKVP